MPNRWINVGPTYKEEFTLWRQKELMHTLAVRYFRTKSCNYCLDQGQEQILVTSSSMYTVCMHAQDQTQEISLTPDDILWFVHELSS